LAPFKARGLVGNEKGGNENEAQSGVDEVIDDSTCRRQQRKQYAGRNAAGPQRRSDPGVRRCACGRWRRDADQLRQPAAGCRERFYRQRRQRRDQVRMFGADAVWRIVPKRGYLVCNNSPHPLYVSDVGEATVGGTAIHIPPHATFVTPPGYAPQQAVSLYGPTTGQSFAARFW
jgi:hypothetical protein